MNRHRALALYVEHDLFGKTASHFSGSCLRINIFQWSFDSSIRKTARCNGMRMLESDHWREYIPAMAVSSPDLKAFLLATPFFGGLSDAGGDLPAAMLAERPFDPGPTVVAGGREGGRALCL